MRFDWDSVAPLTGGETLTAPESDQLAFCKRLSKWTVPFCNSTAIWLPPFAVNEPEAIPVALSDILILCTAPPVRFNSPVLIAEPGTIAISEPEARAM